MLLDKPDDKAAAAAEREKIPFIDANKGNDNKEADPKAETEDADAEEDSEEDEASEDDEEANEEQEEETEEAKAAREAAENERLTRKEKRGKDRRIAKLTAQNTELQNRIAALEAKDENPDKTLTLKEAEELANSKAELKAVEIANAKEFNKIADSLFDAGVKIGGDEFKNTIKEWRENEFIIPSPTVYLLGELPNGGAVLNELTKDEEEAERIFSLSPIKQALALTKLSEKLKPQPKKVSKVQKLNTNVGGDNRGNALTLSDKDDTKDWIEKRNKQVAERRRDKGY